MNAQLLLVATIVLPLLAAALVLMLRRRPDVAAAAGTAAAQLAALAGIGLLAEAPPWRSGRDVVEVDVAWLGLLGSRLHLGWDAITAPLVVLTSVVGALSCLYLWFSGDDAQPGETTGKPPHPVLLALLLVTQAGSVACFTARDLIVFFVAFETVLLPIWLIIARFGQPAVLSSAGVAAATRFVLYTATGSAVLLLGLLYLAVSVGSTDFDAVTAATGRLPTAVQTAVAVLLVVGLGVKVPVWPLHSWLPPAHTTAPTVGSVLLAGVLLKLGSYGLVRLAAGMVPDGLRVIAVPLAVAGVIGILWGGLVCLVERDLKRLVAFSSVAHMGFVVIGVASGTPEGLQGALFAGVAHGVVTSLLFWVVGMLKHRCHHVRLDWLPAGLRDSMPRLGWTLALAAVAGAGIPGLAGFWGEMLAIIGAWTGRRNLGSGALSDLAGPPG
jgi:NADH-quinone oxidoreductase subunit M